MVRTCGLGCSGEAHGVWGNLGPWTSDSSDKEEPELFPSLSLPPLGMMNPLFSPLPGPGSPLLPCSVPRWPRGMFSPSDFPFSRPRRMHQPPKTLGGDSSHARWHLPALSLVGDRKWAGDCYGSGSRQCIHTSSSPLHTESDQKDCFLSPGITA